MMRRLMVPMAMLLLACGGEHRAAPASASSDTAATVRAGEVDSMMARVIPAAAVTLAVQAMPDKADSILAANGFTVDRFEAALYAIAADTTASHLFESALGH